jgi:hypothetical protein
MFKKGVNMPIADAVQLLTTHPKNFLQKNALVIAGGNGRPAGPTIFNLTNLGTTLPQRNHNTARPKYQVQVSAGNNGGNPGPGVVLAPSEFVAFYIPMKQLQDPAANVFAQPNPAITPLMLTSQLTGCTFAFSNTGGNFMAGHIQPSAQLNQDANRAAMTMKASIGLGANTKVVQKGGAYTHVATIVAVYRHDTWKVYMQRIDYIAGVGMIGYEEIQGITKL